MIECSQLTFLAAQYTLYFAYFFSFLKIKITIKKKNKKKEKEQRLFAPAWREP